MQQPQTLPGSGKVALIYGLIFGLIIGAIDVAYSAFLDIANPSFFQTLAQALSSIHNETLFNTVFAFIVSIPLYLLLFVTYFLAGLFAARKTKKSSTGLLAGLWSGVVFVIIDLGVVSILLLYLIVFPQIARSGVSGADLTSFENSELIFSVSYSLIAGIILIGLGVGIGALGGLLGKGNAAPVQPWPYAAPSYQPPYGQNPPPGQPPQVV